MGEIERALDYARREWWRISLEAFHLVRVCSEVTGRPPDGCEPILAELEGEYIRVHFELAAPPVVFPAAWLLLREEAWKPLMEAEVVAARKRHAPES